MLIALLSCLGSVLFLGGAYAILDGWPYLVLERGFTQVILGAIAVAAGLCLLGMTAVLAEVRRVRKAIAGIAVPTAAVPGSPDAVLESIMPLRPERDPAREAALAGAAAAAGMAVAAGAAHPAEHDVADAATPELLDLVDEKPVSDDAELEPMAHQPSPDATEEKDEAAPIRPAIADAEPSEPHAAELRSDHVIAQAPQGSDPDLRDGDRAEPSIPWPTLRPALDENDGRGAEPASEAVPAIAPSAPMSPPAEPEADDLGWLRRDLSAGPAAPEKDRAETELSAAGAWMTQPEEPSEGSEADAASETVGEDERTAVDLSVDFDRPALAEPAPLPEDAPEPPAADTPPAASAEGVIGAYQVGDTHFTMYADGSIRARTRDGEYSFASMDELKTYLASEKSRIEP